MRLPDRDLVEIIGGATIIVLTVAVLAVWSVLSFIRFYDRRVECVGLGSSLCAALSEVDAEECRAGEGCGLPLPQSARTPLRSGQ
jgi:hypothetical protein